MSDPSLFGLALDEVCRAAAVSGYAVGSCPTISPLPLQAVCFLLRFLSGMSLGITEFTETEAPDLSSHAGLLPARMLSGIVLV